MVLAQSDKPQSHSQNAVSQFIQSFDNAQTLAAIHGELYASGHFEYQSINAELALNETSGNVSRTKQQLSEALAEWQAVLKSLRRCGYAINWFSDS